MAAVWYSHQIYQTVIAVADCCSLIQPSDLSNSVCTCHDASAVTTNIRYLSKRCLVSSGYIIININRWTYRIYFVSLSLVGLLLPMNYIARVLIYLWQECVNEYLPSLLNCQTNISNKLLMKPKIQFLVLHINFEVNGPIIDYYCFCKFICISVLTLYLHLFITLLHCKILSKVKSWLVTDWTC